MISFIVPTYNEEKYLPNLLDCIKKQGIKDYEIIVSDNNSSDKTVEIAKSFNAKIVKGGIPSVGRNNGAKSSVGELLIFIDSDITFDNDFIKTTLDNFLKRNLDLAVCKFSIKSELISQSIHNFFSNLFMILREKTKMPLGNGGVIICKKHVFNKLKGFDENLIFSEDQDFFRRAVNNHNFKFGVINTYFNHSSRRYKKTNFLIVFFAGFLASSTIFLLRKQFFKKAVLYKILKLYGDFGKWNNSKSI